MKMEASFASSITHNSNEKTLSNPVPELDFHVILFINHATLEVDRFFTSSLLVI